MDQRTCKVISYIGNNFNDKLSLADMAQLVNLSSPHLCRLFKTETRMAPGRYLKFLKMYEAQRLLETT